MKKTVVLFIAIFAIGYLQGQQLVSQKQQEIQQAVVNMFQALSDRDSVALKSHCTPDVVFYEYGQTWSIDTLIRKAIILNRSTDFQRTNIFEFIHTEPGKKLAWVTYRLHSTIIKDATETDIHWLETVILKRQGKQWRIKHLHSTMIKRG